MKRTSGKLLACLLILALLAGQFALAAQAATLNLPSGLRVIEDEAFLGSTAIDKVVVPEGTEKIGPRAFAGSSVSEIELPASLTEIAEDAFEGASGFTVSVPLGCYAYDWCVDHGLIDLSAYRVEVEHSPAEAYVGSTVTWTASALNGGGSYKYLFELYRDGVKIDTRALSTEASYSHTVAEPGSYHVFVKVMDAKRKQVTARTAPIAIGYEALRVSGVTCGAEVLRLGDSAQWTVSAAGGQAPYTFAFTLEQGGETVAEQAYSESAVFSHTFTGDGLFELTPFVKDALGAEAAGEPVPVSVGVYPLEILSMTADAAAPLTEDPITWTVAAQGGKAPYSYTFEVFADGVSLGRSAPQSENTFSYTPETAQTCYAAVEVTDLYGTAVQLESAELTVSTKPLQVVSVTADQEWVHVGDTATWTIEAVGGVKPLQYALDIYLEGEWIDGTPYEDTNVLSYTTDEPGVYAVDAFIEDAEGATATLTGGEMRFYTDLDVSGISADLDSCLTGEPVTWSVDLTGGKGILTYCYSVYWGDVLEFTATVYDEGELVYAPMHSGEYTVHVSVTDENGVSGSAVSGSLSVDLHPSSPVEDFEFEVLNGTYCELVKYNGSDAAVVIPESDGNNHIVKNICKEAFKNNTALRSVVIPAKTESMGKDVFSGCTNLLTVVGGEKLTNIGESAFRDCTSLKNYSFSKNTAEIGHNAFKNCISLRSFEGWDGLALIGQFAFEDCFNIVTAYLPDSVETLYNNVFADCVSLTSVNFPKGWTTKKNYSGDTDSPFTPCPSLTGITVPEGVTAIPAYAFCNAETLTQISLPSTLTSIGGSAFADCTGLTSIDLPESLTSIARYAFDGSGLVSIEIPDAVTELGSAAFADCKGLVSVKFHNALETISDNAFAGCEALTDVTLPTRLKTLCHEAFEDCVSLTAIHLPDSIETMENNVFSGSERLHTVNYPLNWTTKTNYSGATSSPFADCASLKTITVPEGVTFIPAYAFCNAASFTQISLPSTLTAINNYAFQHCASLPAITLPESLTSIGVSAFEGCSSLHRIVIPDSVTSLGNEVFQGCLMMVDVVVSKNLRTIPEYAFEGCAGMTAVTLPEGIRTIEHSAFRNCTSLEGVRLPDSIETLHNNVFSGCEKLHTVNYPLSWTTKTNYSGTMASPFADCVSLKTITVPEGVTFIPAYAFHNAAYFTQINLPSTLTAINDYAFFGCSGLLAIELPEGLTSIGSHAFDGCSSLGSIEIPDSVTAMGNSAFADCGAMTEAVVGEGVTVLRDHAFASCASLTDVALPETLLTVEHSAFQDCKALESIQLPDSITTLHNDVFNGCENLRSVNLPLSWTAKVNYSGTTRSPFASCAVLYGIDAPEGMTAIPENAFRGMDNLLRVTLPSTLTAIGANAFYGCSSLMAVSIPANVESIADSAFARASEDLIIYGTAGSAAETFAAENGFEFRSADELPSLESLAAIFEDR